MTTKPTLSLAHATLLDVSPPDLVRIAADVGYDAVGLRLIPMGRPGEPRHVVAEQPELLRETARALEDTGVRVLDVEVAQIRDDLDPRAYVPDFEVAAELGARFVLTNVYTPDPAFAARALAELCDLARPFGLSIALECVSFSNLTTVGDTIELVRASGRQNASVLIDTLHFHSSRAPLGELALLPPDRVQYVHVCDGPRDIPEAPEDLRRIARAERLMPGEGGIDLAGMLDHLPRDIVYAVEIQNPDRSRALGAEGYARLAFEKTGRCLQRLPAR